MILSRIANIVKTVGYARRGIGIRNKCLFFFLAGFGSLNPSRVRTRRWFFRSISSFGDGQCVEVRFKRCNQSLAFWLREGDEGDYLIGSELAKDGYDLPEFEPDQIVDGGANIGLFAIVAGAVFPRARLVCFEPDLANFEMLQQNLHLNNIRAQCYRLGLWSKETTLYYHARHSHTGFINEKPSDVAIRCITPDIEKNCWLKLDIESAEYEVLPALLNSRKYPRWITMEIHQYAQRGYALTELLHRHGYVLRGGNDKLANQIIISAWRNLR